MDLLNKIAVFYSQNKDAIQLLVVVVVYVIAHRQAVFAYARKKAGTLMLSAEKGATDLLLNSGADKMDWVVQKAYQKMPAAVRMVVSMESFQKIAQKIFDEAKLLIEQHKSSVPAVPTPAAATTVMNTTVHVQGSSDGQKVADAVAQGVADAAAKSGT